MADDVLILNDYGLTQRTRTSASGNVKQRYTISIDAERLVMSLDPKTLGKAVATAIATMFRQRITGIADTAAPATLKAREVAKRAMAKGKTWATKRYAGGKIGAMAPGSSSALFNDSGRLAKSITAGSTGDSWIVNVAANRFSPDTLDHGGTSALRTIVDRLRQFLPELGDGEALMNALPVRAAMKDATAKMFQKLSASSSSAALEVAVKVFELAQQAGEEIEAA